MDPTDISAVVVYELLKQLQADVRDQHARLRADMNSGFDRVAAQAGIGAVCVLHGKQLVMIETILSERQRVSSGRVVALTVGVATGTTVLYQVITRAWDALAR